MADAHARLCLLVSQLAECCVLGGSCTCSMLLSRHLSSDRPVLPGLAHNASGHLSKRPFAGCAQWSFCRQQLKIAEDASAHAGIGRSINRLEQIDVLKRPLTMEEGGVVLMDLLWSDPTTNDGVEGVQPSPRGPGLVTFGPDRVKEFCKVGFSA